MIFPGEHDTMKSTTGRDEAISEDLHLGAPGPDDHGDQGNPVLERICDVGFGVIAVGVCLQALAAAAALALVLAMVVLSIAGGSMAWAIVVALATFLGGCSIAAVCCMRRRRAGKTA